MSHSAEVGINGEDLLESLGPFKRDLTPGLILREEAIAALPRIETVVILGSSAVGKTSLLEILRGMAQSSSLLGNRPIAFPKRFITRLARQNDDTIENTHVTSSDFDNLISSGDVDIWWSRRIGERKAERYGFAPKPEGQLAIYSGNNALLASSEPSAQQLITESLVLQVFAPVGVRSKRIGERSPDLAADEIAGRLADTGEQIINNKRVHGILSMYGQNDDYAIDAAATIVKLINIS